MRCVCNGRMVPLLTIPDLRNLKSRNFIVTQFLKRKEIEIIFLKRAPHLSMREWKLYQAKMAEEYCSAELTRQDGHAAASKFPVCWTLDLYWTPLCDTYLVASKCSRSPFVCEKYKTVKSFKLHFVQNSSLVQLCTSASDCKGIWNMPGGHFVKALSAIPSHSYWFLWHRTSALPSVLIQSREQVNISCSEARRVWKCFSVFTLFSAKKSLTTTDQCAGALSWRRNQLLDLHFWGVPFWLLSLGDEGYQCTFLYSQ
jgi:hypothetical protein